MKKPLVMAMLAGAGCSLMLNSCSNSDEMVTNEAVRLDSELVTGIRVTLPDSPFAKETRTAHSIVSGAMHTDWQLGDTLGIYPIGGDQVAFPISAGEGTNTAKFDGGAWALRSCYSYAAYYPFTRSNVFVKETELPFDYSGQVQDGDGSLTHLGKYDFLAAAASIPDEDGSVDLTLNHLGCFVRMQLTMPKAGTFTSVDIETNSGAFTTEGTVNLAAETPALAASETSSKLSLGLENVSTASDNQVITLYMMVAPVDMSGKTLTFTVTDNAGKTYSQTAAGKNMIATYAYGYTLDFGQDTSANGGGILNGHAYVDLGLTTDDGKPLYWATCNVGAEQPEDNGLYFAWGETDGYTTYAEDSHWFGWNNYKLCDGRSDALTKYCNSRFYGTVDEKTVLDPEDDAAYVIWGGGWRMPTKEEQDKLCTECIWTKPMVNGKKLFEVTGPNGNSIYLPCPGYRDGNKVYGAGKEGYYWSSTLCLDVKQCSSACDFYFDFYNGVQEYHAGRQTGMSIRPVCTSR